MAGDVVDILAGLAEYKRPREIRFTGWLPRSPVGKVLKKDLRGKLL